MVARRKKSTEQVEQSFFSDSQIKTEQPPEPVKRPIPKQPEVLTTERHNTPSGVLILEFNVRTRKYQRLQLGSQVLSIDSPDRNGIMPILIRMNCVPTGWRKVYEVETNGEQEDSQG